MNARYVKRFGMEICKIAFSMQIVWSGLFCLYHFSGFEITLMDWLIYIVPVLFLMGLTFGNLQSVAMEPMGAIAGTASTVIGSLMTAISLGVGVIFLSSWLVKVPTLDRHLLRDRSGRAVVNQHSGSVDSSC